MKMYIQVSEENRVLDIGSTPMGEGSVEIEVEEGHEILGNPFIFKWENGELIKDVEYQNQLIAEYEAMLAQKSPEEEIAELKKVSSALIGGSLEQSEETAAQVNKAMQMFAQTLPEEKALEIPEVFPPWEIGKDYAAMQYVKDGFDADGKRQLFQIMQAHKSQADWKPKDTPALYKKVGFTGGGVAVWVQPQGGHDAYKLDDIVSHKGKQWKSTANGNVWEPGVYGWVEVAAGAAAANKK